VAAGIPVVARVDDIGRFVRNRPQRPRDAVVRIPQIMVKAVEL
jgi:hypothetical protein